LSGRFDDELTTWVKTYTGELLSWAVRRTSDDAAAEDLVQETFLAAAEQIATFRRESQPRTWLYSILNNKIAEYHRRKAREQTASITPDDPAFSTFGADGHWIPENAPLPWEHADEHLLDNPDFVRIFEECLAQLPGEWHGCLTSKFLQNRPAEEICQELSISTTNYWQIIHRAKLKMRACLEQHWFAKDA
jgi:RNA polymerase sigma-70 factor (TIGR02943 family)